MSFQPLPGEAFYISLNVLKASFIYPMTDTPQGLRIFWTILVIVKFFTFFNLFGVLVHFVVSLRKGLFIVLFEDFALIPSYIGLTLPCMVYCYHHRFWSAFFRRLLDFKKFGKPSNFDSVAKRFNRISIGIVCWTYFTASVYVYVKITDTTYCEELNKKMGINEICGLIAPFWWPSELTPMTKKILVSLQTLSLMLVVQGGIFIVFPTENVVLMKTRADHCAKLFRQLFDDNTGQRNGRYRHEEYGNKLDFCIEYHIELFELCMNFREGFILCMWWSSAAATGVIAGILTEFIQVHNYAAMARGINWIVGVAMLCHSGQIFQDSLLPIYNAVYCSKWYEADVKIQKKLKLVMQRSQKPTVLQAMPCGDHNYGLFLKLAKACYSVLTLMNKK